MDKNLKLYTEALTYDESQKLLKNTITALKALEGAIQEAIRIGGLSAYERKYGIRELIRRFDTISDYRANLFDDMVS